MLEKENMLRVAYDNGLSEIGYNLIYDSLDTMSGARQRFLRTIDHNYRIISCGYYNSQDQYVHWVLNGD